MAVVLKVKLKEDFREPLKSKIGFFGRESELSRLVALFRRRNAATVLISGHRGVGKSALVDEALKIVKTQNKKILVAKVTLPHIYSAKKDNSSLRDQILRGLTRALYFVVKDERIPKNLKSHAQSLYTKTYLKEFREETVLGSIAESETQSRSSRTIETKIRPDKMALVGLGSLLSGILGVAGVSVVSDVAKTAGPWWALVSAAAIIGVVVVSGITVKKMSKSEKTVTDTITATDERTQIGEFDISPETLEFELRALIGNLAESNRPCVFVIDELDKLEIVQQEGESDNKLEDHVIFNLVSVLKNFFTLGTGIYVFIAGENFYSQLSDSISRGDYSVAHTLFTDRLFIHILHYRAIEQLIDSMIEGKPSDDRIYKKFKNYLCWESRNHVFDLLSFIDEFVSYQDGHPVLLAREEGEEDGRWQGGNLPPDWQGAAGLQKYAGAAYDESRLSSSREERYNQALWLSLIDTLKKLYNGQTIDVEDEEYKIPDMDWTKGLSDKDKDDLAGAVERLLAKLERYGAVTVQRTTKEKADEEEERDVPITRYELYEDASYPPSSVGTEATLIPIEKSFVELITKVQSLSKNIQSIEVSVDSFNGDFEKITKLSDQVKKTTFRFTVPRSQTREGIKKADELVQQLVDTGIDGSIHKWAETSGVQISKNIDETETRTGQPWKSSLGAFTELTDVLVSENIDYYILGGGASENQLLIVNNSQGKDLSKVSEAYSKALPGEKGREIRKQRLPILIVDHSETGDEPKIPQEVVEEIESEYEGTFFSRYWFFNPKRRKKIAKLSG